MPCSGCSALHGMNPNLKKNTEIFKSKTEILPELINDILYFVKKTYSLKSKENGVILLIMF